jgi:hypothetical protein
MNFAPVNYDETDADQPAAIVFDTGSYGTTTPYTTALNTIISRNVENIQQTVPKPTDWKKRLREFLSIKNTELLDFVNATITTHPTIGKGDAILRTFGCSAITNPTSRIIRNIVFDLSGTATMFESVKEELKSLTKGEDPLAEFKTTIEYIYEQYRISGDAILKHESYLKTKLDIFDHVQKNIVNLLELDPTSCTDELKGVSQKYLGEIFEKHRIQTTYNELIGSYQRFIVFRELVSMMRVVQSNEHEPLCTICLERQVTHCVAPCGHTYCEQCLRRQTTSCFMCRTPVREKVRIFFG